MTDDLRARIARAATAIARDSGTSVEGGNLILVDLDQLLDAVERAIQPAFLITSDARLSEADVEQLRADFQITPRPERPADAGWGPGDFVDYIPEDGPEVHALPELDGIYDEDGH